jgi:hypothetical protein
MRTLIACAALLFAFGFAGHADAAPRKQNTSIIPYVMLVRQLMAIVQVTATARIQRLIGIHTILTRCPLAARSGGSKRDGKAAAITGLEVNCQRPTTS